MATQEDRSLSAGVSFPRWMKSKMTDKFDFEQSAFSPTELDDSFMYYYRNPLQKRSLTKEINNLTETSNNTTTADTMLMTQAQQIQDSKPDFSKHTPSCQRFLNTNDITFTQKMKTPPPTARVRSSGTDDGFKSEAAECGSSIIKVAHQMVSGKVVHGFSINKDDDFEQNLEKFDPHRRRGSRSLPASPLTSPGSSPKSKRRVNKYFTGAFVDADKNKGGWILSNLLARREISQSVGYIGEESKEEMERSASTASVDVDVLSNSNKNSVFKAKPSELREMNFWSPTSM